MPAFSLVIPVYNVEPYLKECLDSVLRQSLDNWEAVCVNDGSTDGSAAILEEYAARDPRIRVISQSNRGLSAARNTGFDAAQGDYILFLDSDDWLETNTLETIACHLQDEDMLCFGGRRYDEETHNYRPVDILDDATYNNGMDYYNANALLQRDFAFVCVVLRCYRREILVENGLHFREGILHEDNEFTPRVCLKAKSVKVIPDILYNYRIRSGSIMTTRGLKSKESLITIGNELSELFAQENGFDKTVIYRYLTQCYQMAFINNTHEEDRKLRKMIDWQCYRRVSNTKPRHRLQYLLLRFSVR